MSVENPLLIALVICLPALGALGSWFLLRHTGTVAHFARWHALHKTHGRALFFDDQPMRVRRHEGRALVAAGDVHRALARPCTPQILRRLRLSLGESALLQFEDGEWWFSEEAVLAWLGRAPDLRDRRAQRLRRWLEHEVFRPMQRAQESAP